MLRRNFIKNAVGVTTGMLPAVGYSSKFLDGVNSLKKDVDSHKKGLDTLENKPDSIEKNIGTLDTHSYKLPGIVAAKNVIERSPYFQAMAHTNYYGARGTNSLEVCAAVFVIGTPQPTGNAIADIARSVWYERDEPFDTKRYAEPCPYNYRDENANQIT